jgi:RNA polymerase sigma-70 factor, ECF subfamily
MATQYPLIVPFLPLLLALMAARHDPFATERVKRAQNGDEAARSTLLTDIEPVLRGYFIKRIGKIAEVDDLVQNTLLRVHRGLEDLKKPGSLKSFAMKAALYELQDYYRGRYDMKERLFNPDIPPERAEAGVESAGMDVEKALASLSPKARRIIELREYGYIYREIAQMLDTTEAAVKMQVKRAFDTMRDALSALLVALLIYGLV